MNHELILPIYRGEDTIPPRPVFLITLNESNLQEWCLKVMLLTEQHINAVTLIDPKDDFRLHLCIQFDGHSSYIEWEDEPEIHFGEPECGHLLTFGLRYYRDGVAEVTETDIELYHPDETNSVARLIVRAAHSRPPLSPAEIRAILSRD